MIEPSLLCYCTVCDRQFQYGDEVSPMFTDEIWKALISHYGLEEHERRAMERIIRSKPKLQDRDAHTFICADCAEKALGRPLQPADLNGSLFNDAFIKNRFR